jgi:hypothetical protein
MLTVRVWAGKADVAPTVTRAFSLRQFLTMITAPARAGLATPPFMSQV